MSYEFGMFFTECEPKNVLSTCLSIVNTIVDNPDELIKDNVSFCPSRRFKSQLDLYVARNFDQTWLYEIFNFHFVYWKQYNLLGLSGYNYGENVNNLFKCHICFQNSSDQDYEYDIWKGIT